MSDFHHLFRLFFFLLSLAASFIGLWMWAVLFWTCFPCCNLRGAVLFAGSTSSGCCATTKTVPFTPTTSPSFPLLCEWSHAPLCELGHSWGNSSRQTSKVCGGVFTTLIVRKNIFYIYSFALPAFVLTNCTGDEPKQKNEIIIAGLNWPSRLHRETNEKEFSSSVLGLWLLQTAKMWDKNLNNIYLCVYVGVLWGVSSWCTPSCTRWSDTCAPASSHQRMPPSWSALASPYLRLSLFSQASAAQCLFRSTPGLQSCLFPPRVRTVVCWWWLTPARLHLHPGCQSKSWKWSQGSGRVLLSCQRSRCWRRS